MKPNPAERADFANMRQGEKVSALWMDAVSVRSEINRAIGEELDFSLKMRHYLDDKGETKDRRRIQPKGRELISKLRHKIREITKDLFITTKAVDQQTDPSLADAVKWVLEHDVNDPIKDYAQVREDWVMLGLAGRLGVVALDYVPGVGAFGGEVLPRVVDPRLFYWTPGWKSPHDPTCPWVIEVRRMRVADVQRMGEEGGWKNTDKVMGDGGLDPGGKRGDPDLVPGTVRFMKGGPGNPDFGSSDVEPRATILFAWFRNDDTRSSRMKEGSLRKLRPDQRYMSCQACGYSEPPSEESDDLPKTMPCPQCGMEMDRVDAEADSEQVLSYPNGRLTIVSVEDDDLELFDDAWPYKIRSVPYGVFQGYPHPLEQIGMSDTAYDWSLQLITDALLRQAYEQMSENRDLIIAPVDGLVDAEGEPWQFADTQGRIAYWTGQGAPAIEHFQGTGIPNGWGEIFGQVQSVLMRDMGTSDIAIGSENTRNIPVGTVRALQETGEVPVDHHKVRLWRAESILLGVWLDMIRDTWTLKRMVRLNPENGQQMFMEIKGSDIPNADVLVSAAPAINNVDQQEIQALTTVLQQPPPMQKLLARKVGISQADLAEYQQEMDAFQKQQQPQPPPASPDKILVAMSDILKTNPSYVSYEQVQQALSMAGIKPVEKMTPLQQVHAVQHFNEKTAAAQPPAPDIAAMNGGTGNQPPMFAGRS